MNIHVQRGLGAVLAGLLGALANAQTLKIGGAPILYAGQSATINYSNRSLANQTVSVRVAGGFPTVVQWVPVRLNANGDGTASWPVNTQWLMVAFNAPGVNEIACVIY